MDLITFSLFLIAVLVIVTNLFALWWLGYLLLPYFYFGGPYVPSSHSRVDLMIEKAKLTNTDHVVDLGSGDGRIILAAAQAGAGEAVGYEIHKGLVKAAQLKAKKQGVADRAKFLRQNFWGVPLDHFNVVFLYQIPYAMKKISAKLQAELPHGARIISNGYEIPGFELLNADHKVYVYRKP